MWKHGNPIAAKTQTRTFSMKILFKDEADEMRNPSASPASCPQPGFSLPFVSISKSILFRVRWRGGRWGKSWKIVLHFEALAINPQMACC